MAISEAFAGSASISTTEYDLPTASTVVTPQTSDGIFQLFLDLNALTAGDEYQLRVYEKTRSSSTQRLVDETLLVGIQPEPVFVTPALLLLHGWTYTLKKLAGTDRTIEWSIRQVA